MSDKTVVVNEVFYSLQGEGMRTGTANVFVRFTGCNLACSVEPGPRSPGGFDCDTEFMSGRRVTLDELREWVDQSQKIALGKDDGQFHLIERCKWLILTGGEPGLQVDREFCDYFHGLGYKLAIETNGTVELPKKWVDDSTDAQAAMAEVVGEGSVKDYLLDWITLSPKVAEHAVKQLWANEIKYVRGWGQGIPKPAATAEHYLISPAADGYTIHPKTMQWVMRLVLENPMWRLSCQQHKWWNVR